MVFYSAFHSLSDNLYHSIYFFSTTSWTDFSEYHGQWFSDVFFPRCLLQKNIIAFVFLVTQHAIRTAEELLKLSLKDVYFAIEHNFYDNHDKTVA